MKENNQNQEENEIASIIQERRQKAGMSQADLAKAFNEHEVTESMVRKWEKGVELPDATVMYELSEILKVNITEFLRIRNDVKRLTVERPPSFHKYVGRTFWDVFGDFIMSLIKIAILAAIIFCFFKFDVIGKFKEFANDNTVQDENYIVDDEYLRMLNSKNGKGVKDYQEK